MKTARRTLILLGVMAMMCVLPAQSQHLEDQVVNWTDFSYVNYIASSMTYVYFATTGGITRYNKVNRTWEEPLTGSPGIDSERINRIWVDTFDEHLYVETEVGLYEYDPLFGSWFPIDELPAVRTNTRHVALPQPMIPPPGFNYTASGNLIDPYARSWGVVDAIDDGAGTFWLGTWGYGAATAEVGPNEIEILPYGLLQNDITNLLFDGDILWIAGRAAFSARTGLSAFDLANQSFSYIESGTRSDFPTADVTSLEVDENALYVGTDIGLMLYNFDLERFVDRLDRRNGLTSDEVVCLRKVGDSLFIGTAGGLTVLDFVADSVQYVNPSELFNQVIYDIEPFGEHVWIGAENGAYRLSRADGKLQKFRDPTQVLFSRVYNIESYEQEIWFASDLGVVRMDTETGESRDYSLPSLRYGSRALAVNDGVAAVASDRGMTLIFREEHKPVSREFSIDDGLASDRVTSLLLDGDYLWIGTDRGLTRFYWNNPRRID